MNARRCQWLAFAALLSMLPLLRAADAPVAPAPLPRMLYMCDSIHGRIVQLAVKELKDRVTVKAADGKKTENSQSALANLDALLGDQPWDLIYFNFGLGDLHYMAPGLSTPRAMDKDAGGVRMSSPEVYEKTLDELARRLKATGAAVVWGSTTPLVNLQYKYRVFDAGSEIEYNAIAARIMTKHGIPVVDLHGFITQALKDEEKMPAYSAYDSHLVKKGVAIQQPIVDAVTAALRLPPKS